MSKAVMISIKPRWCELIANGKKTIEVRKTKPKLKTPFKVYIYCTKDESLYRSGDKFCCNNGEFGNGKVIGEFVCDKITVAELGNYCILPKKKTWIDEFDLLAYADEKTIYGWHISNLVIYDKPRELSEFRSYNTRAYFDEEIGLPMPTHEITRPPQSWCYVEGVANE